MPAISYILEHLYQTQNNNCSQTALAMLLSHYGQAVTPEAIQTAIPVNLNDDGEPWGTINQQLATWCISQGYTVEMYSFDCQAIDLSWQYLGKEALLARLAAAKEVRDVPALGPAWSRQYLEAYVAFIEAGGELHIKPHVTTRLLVDLLQAGPILACVCFSTLYGLGRSRYTGLRQSVDDDLNGVVYNHSIVIYGLTDDGRFEIADPIRPPGRHVVEPETLLCAITAAQIECDNLIFQIKKAP